MEKLPGQYPAQAKEISSSLQREMLLSEAQCEVRTAYLGGFVGQLVSAMIWFASAAIATLVDAKTGFWALALGGWRSSR